MVKNPINSEEVMLCKSDILDRGWTQRMIERFLPEPDATKTNPYYKKAPPMKLYLKDRVEKVEKSDEFKQALEKSDQRKLGSRKAVETKTLNLLDYIESIEIVIPQVSIDIIRTRAIYSYNERQFDKGNFESDIDENSSPDMLDRITVNFLRHEMTTYERQLSEIFGKIGKGKAYAQLKKKILEKIAAVYPVLETECRRQINNICEG